ERFRPCWLTLGPDGAIYIADMYRGVVQDSPHMSPYLREISIAREMVLPIHKGRIWRIVPERFERGSAPTFSSATSQELIAFLANPSGWWRDQAQMHLVEGNRREAIPGLIKMARRHESHLARLHALWTLEGLRFDQPEKLLFALTDPHPEVAAASIRVIGSLGLPQEGLASELERLCGLKSLPNQVALQILLTSGDLSNEKSQRFTIIEKVMTSRFADPLMRDAAISSLGGEEAKFLVYLGSRDRPGFAIFAEALAQAASSDSADQIEILLSYLEDIAAESEVFRSLVTGIEMGVTKSKERLSLRKEPSLLTSIPELAEWFTWPGHEISLAKPSASELRPLKPRERVQFSRGRQVYLATCVACHGNDGLGMKLVAPPLAGSDWVLGSDERLARVLFHGLNGPITVSGRRYASPEVQPMMPPLATLDNKDTAAVLTYIRREWGNTADPISTSRVGRLRIEAQGRTIPWTEAELAPYESIGSLTQNEE
ncbi:MAG: c-type cytochrome, partial [Verrucomicrobiota bacterium]